MGGKMCLHANSRQTPDTFSSHHWGLQCVINWELAVLLQEFATLCKSVVRVVKEQSLSLEPGIKVVIAAIMQLSHGLCVDPTELPATAQSHK